MRFDESTGWWIPDGVFKSHPIRAQQKNDINVIPKAISYTKAQNCVVQAGGRLGLWPKMLAEHFKMVYTFEPETENYECAVKNLAGIENINLYKAALGERQEHAFLELNRESGSGGSHYIVKNATRGKEAQPVDVMNIDSMGLAPDLIMLDIEGFELYALIGARHTIAKHKPIIVIESHDAMKRYGVRKPVIASYLHELGYDVVDRQYKDLILAWQEPKPVCTATE